MTYVISDLHGISLEDFRALLDRAGFGQEDVLYVLGDVIDRGEHGIDLLRYMASQSNIRFILGNHESMMLGCTFLFTGEKVTEDGELELSEDEMLMLYNWLGNGGRPSLEGFVKLIGQSTKEALKVLNYVRKAPLHATVEVGGRKFVLVHAGLDNFRPDRPLDDYSPEDLIWARPGLDVRYYDDATVIFGHTPTLFYGEEYRGRPVYTDTWICIDVGAAAKLPPLLLRLDDMREFY